MDDSVMGEGGTTGDTDGPGRVVVVGGGLAGLAAATTAALNGARVTLLEARTEEGGRARTVQHDGFSFNQGPHALYRAGAGLAVLRSLGIEPEGRMPNLATVELAEGGCLRRAANPFLTAGPGAAFGRALLGSGATERAAGLTMQEWVDRLDSPRSRQLARAMVRLTSYTDDLHDVDATAAIAQLRRGLRGVLYLHHGWASLVDSLRAAAAHSGVQVRTGVRVTAVRPAAAELTSGTRELTVVLDGAELRAGTVVLANGGPSNASRLLGGVSASLRRQADRARPVTVACLDVALERLPRPAHGTVVGLDEPTYLIAHSRTARLAPKGAAMVHVMHYGPTDDNGARGGAGSGRHDGAADVRRSLESQLDRAQPGWRDLLVEARFGRRLVVAHDVPRCDAPRPDVAVTDAPGVFVAGDWVHANGLLADAALDSGHRGGLAAATRATLTSTPARTCA